MTTRSTWMNGIRTLGAMGAAALVVTSGSAARAATAADPLKCEALELIVASRASSCVARCDRVANRQAGDDPADAEDFRYACTGTCKDRYAAGLSRLHERSVCRGAVPGEPSPMECQAKQQRNDAALLLCQARCNTRARSNARFDARSCGEECIVDYDAAREDILNDPVCVDGPVMSSFTVPR